MVGTRLLPQHVKNTTTNTKATPHRRTYHLVDVEGVHNTFELAERLFVAAESLEVSSGGVPVAHHMGSAVFLGFVGRQTQPFSIKLFRRCHRIISRPSKTEDGFQI